MREESGKPNAELNEAALENVSGGGNPWALCFTMATLLCHDCHLHRNKLCTKEDDLANYLMEQSDPHAISPRDDCPFYHD